MRLITVISVLLLFCSVAYSKVIYVDVNASFPGQGTKKDPYPFIQTGINAATSGDIVLVMPGTYFENIDFLNKNIIVKSSQGPSVTTIDGTNKGIVVWITQSQNSDAELNGFTITHGEYDGGVYCYGTSPIIRNNHFIDNGGNGIKCDYFASPLIIDNLIMNNSNCGIYLHKNSCPMIANNLIIFNQTGIDGGGINCNNHCNPDIINCTIYGNMVSNCGGGVACLVNSQPKIINSIIWQNSAGNQGHQIHTNSATTVQYCNVQGGWPGLGNIDAFPNFVLPNFPVHDFRLQQDPCQPGVGNPNKNAGDPASKKIKGTTRKDGVQDEDIVDMGYHYPESIHDLDKHVQVLDPNKQCYVWALYYSDNDVDGIHDPGEACYTGPGGSDWNMDSSSWMASAANILGYEMSINNVYSFDPLMNWLSLGGAPSPSYSPWNNDIASAPGGGNAMTFDDGGYPQWAVEHGGKSFQQITTDTEFGLSGWKQNPTEWCEKKLSEGHPVCLGMWAGLSSFLTRPSGYNPLEATFYHNVTLWEIDTATKTITITDSDDQVDGPRVLTYTYSGGSWKVLDPYPGVDSAHINYAMCVSSLLEADTHSIIATKGGTVTFTLNAGPENAFREYLLLGSYTGTCPGCKLPGGAVLSLNLDSLTSIMIQLANTVYFQDNYDTLDTDGMAISKFYAPQNALVCTLPLTFYFGYALLHPSDFASNPIPVQVIN